jgi:uncharacterized membrane protein
MNERVQTTLRFVGDWPWWAGLGAAATLVAAVCWLYRPDVRGSAAWLRWALPGLRSAAVAMIVLMLSGPVLHHRKVIGELSRLLLLVDQSRSMGLSDPSMDLGRKLRILQELKMLPPDAVKMELPKAGEALAEAIAQAQKAQVSLNAESSEWNRLLTEFAGRLDEAKELLQQGGATPDRLSAFAGELVEPAREIGRREMRQIDDRQRAAQDLSRLAGVAEKWTRESAALFQKMLANGPAGASAVVQQALQRFDAMPRWQRLQASLLEGDRGKLLARLSEKHDVRLLALQGGQVKKLWEPADGVGTTPGGLPKPEGEVTDLATPLESVIGKAQGEKERGAVVLFSDGQHNDGTSPIDAARILGGRQMPLFPVGFGSTARPRDLAMLKVEAPESVFAEDHVRGQITLKDDMPAGTPFTVSIKDGETVLWEQSLATLGTGQRSVPFDFSMSGPVAERLKADRAGVQRSGIPVEVKVSVSQVEGDGELSNNSASLRVRAVTQRRKILLLDGRPRWESRYLRNMFERDEQWEVTTVVAGTAGSERGFVRGTQPDQFPSDLALLAAYDLVIFGEVPRDLLKPDELQAISDFVEKRGGALVFIDGPRAFLRGYAQTPLEPLFPVDLRAAKPSQKLGGLALLEPAQGLAAFALVPDRGRNLEVWQGLPLPHWISGAPALPGAEVFVEAQVLGGTAPAVVARNFGAGRVLYHAFEDSWRWRYEVADQYHVRYWNQVANWVAELPFAARDRFISLDAGAITYRPGEAAELRVRLRDGQGRPVSNGVVDAVLHRDGARAATIRLAPDENAGGLFRGHTAPLEPGAYEVTVESAAIAEAEARARTSFKVEPRATGELTQLGLNEDLLRQMAIATGGQYLREENIARLIEALAPLSHGRVIESETVLWQSYWWFIPLVLVLGMEWFLRKRAGML